MFFDISYQVAGVEIIAQPEEHQLILSFATAIVVPTPQGRQLLPAGMVKVNINKDVAEKLAPKMLEAAESLPAESDLIIAGDVSQVSQVAEQQQTFEHELRAGPKPEGE